MRCRKLEDKNIVWFKSYGVEEDLGNLYKYDPNNSYWNDYSYTIAEPTGTATEGEVRRWNSQWKQYTSGSWHDLTVLYTFPGDISVVVYYFVPKAKKVDSNYSEELDAVVDSLTQRLSIIRGELWYQINYGLPLLERNNNKAIYDYTILDIIGSHPDVLSVGEYKSYVSKNKYIFNCTINTKYGEIELNKML